MHTQILSKAQRMAFRVSPQTARGKRYVRQFLAAVRETVYGEFPDRFDVDYQFRGERDGREWARRELAAIKADSPDPWVQAMPMPLLP